jgi:hypothetical protein
MSGSLRTSLPKPQTAITACAVGASSNSSNTCNRYVPLPPRSSPPCLCDTKAPASLPRSTTSSSCRSLLTHANTNSLRRPVHYIPRASHTSTKNATMSTMPPQHGHSEACCNIPPIVAKGYDTKGSYEELGGYKTCKNISISDFLWVCR